MQRTLHLIARNELVFSDKLLQLLARGNGGVLGLVALVLSKQASPIVKQILQTDTNASADDVAGNWLSIEIADDSP